MLNVYLFGRVKEYIALQSETDNLKIARAIAALRSGDFSSIHIKTIKGPLKELIVRRARIIFCLESNTIFFLTAFTKKTAKTPKHEIEMAEKTYLQLINN